MVAIGSLEDEGVKELYYVSVIAIELGFVILVLFDRFDPLRVLHILGYFLQYLDLIVGCVDVVWGAFHDFDGDIILILEIPCQPNSGEVSPAQLLYEHIPVEQHLANQTRVISTHFIVFDPFIFAVVGFVQFM